MIPYGPVWAGMRPPDEAVMGTDGELPDAPPSVHAGRVEVRCPEPVRKRGECRPGKLFTVLVLSGQEPSFIHPDNLIEMACLDCKRKMERPVKHVKHRYDFAGNLVDTVVVELDP